MSTLFVKLDEKTKERLRKASHKDNRDMSSATRKAISDYITNIEKRK